MSDGDRPGSAWSTQPARSPWHPVRADRAGVLAYLVARLANEPGTDNADGAAELLAAELAGGRATGPPPRI